jgi:hypothetical protein
MADQGKLQPGDESLVWDRIPAMLGRISSALGSIAHDGQYFRKIPVLRHLAPLVGLLAGSAAGFFGQDDLPYTSNLSILGVLLALGIVSGQVGIMTVIGFVATDAMRQVHVDTNGLPFGYAGAVFVSWFFLFQMVVSLPMTARLMGVLRGRWSVLNGLIACVFTAGFVELWTRLSMVALRPLYIWRGLEPTVELADFAELGNEWDFGSLVLHKLAWLALGIGLGRWAIESIIAFSSSPLPQATSRSRSPRAVRSIHRFAATTGKASAMTAIIAGIFASVAGAVAFWLVIAGSITMRTFASSNKTVAKWDGWMLRIPIAVRLVATFALSYYFSQWIVELLRGIFEWRTMTTAAAANTVAFAASLLLWPQVDPAIDGPHRPTKLDGFLRKFGKAAPHSAVLFSAFSATAAYAHHCSFQPGCECLTDNRALAGLVAAWTTLASLWLILRMPDAPEVGNVSPNQSDKIDPKPQDGVQSLTSPDAANPAPATTTPDASIGQNPGSVTATGVDVDLALATLIANVIPPYGAGKCAAHVRKAINAGGGRVVGVPSAKDFGPQLTDAGFSEIARADQGQVNSYANDASRWKKGDVVVIQAFPGVSDGHMAMYDGTHWVSDFVQRDMWGGPSARNNLPAFKVYRP